MRITGILLGIVLAIVPTAQAETYKLTVAFSVGNQIDLVARAIQASVERNTTDKIIIENVPGAETVMGVMYFKTKKSDALMASSNQTIFNPVLKNDLPYTDADLEHVIYIGATPGLWITRPDTDIKTPRDLLGNIPDQVGGYVSVYNMNVYALNREKNKNLMIIPYKNTNEILVDLVNKSIDLAIVGPNNTLFQLVKAGKLHIIGSTYHKNVTVNDIYIASTRSLGVSTFNGMVAIDIQPMMEAERAKKLKKLLWDAVNDPVTQEEFKNLNIILDLSNDSVYINNFYANYKSKVREYMLKNKMQEYIKQ